MGWSNELQPSMIQWNPQTLPTSFTELHWHQKTTFTEILNKNEHIWLFHMLLDFLAYVSELKYLNYACE